MALATMLFSRLFVCINPIRSQHQSMPAKASELSSAKSKLQSCGFSSLKISYQSVTDNARAVDTSTALVQPLASRVCPLTGKRANNANKISFSNHKTKKLQGVNLQYKRIWWEAGKRYVKLRLSTKALKTIEKKGLDAMAKKAGINLKKR